MKTTYYSYDARYQSSFHVTAVKYEPDNQLLDGVTIIAAHANGTHKETWGPLLEFLFNMAESSTQGPAIREVWSIECPNHGESAVINGPEIAARYPDHWDGWNYPRAILAFLNSSPDGTNFYQRELIALGHSHGGNSLVLLHDLQPRLPFISFILLDPTLGRESPTKDYMQRVITQLTWNKVDTWPSRKAALRHLSKQPGFRNWHPEVLKTFVEKGLRDHPANAYPDPWTFKGVTLACTKAYESAITRANDHHPRAWDVLHQLYRSSTPVHLILSRADEFNASKLKTDQVAAEPISQRKATSVQWIDKGGHMFVQSMPEPTAKAVYNALLMITGKIEPFWEPFAMPQRAHL